MNGSQTESFFHALASNDAVRRACADLIVGLVDTVTSRVRASAERYALQASVLDVTSTVRSVNPSQGGH